MAFTYQKGNNIKPNNSRIGRTIAGNDFLISLRGHLKFKKDVIFSDTENYSIVLDGVIFNKKELISKHDWLNTLIRLYEKEGIDFISRLRGTFSGIFIDKCKKNTYVFVDQIASKSVFYSFCESKLFFDSSFVNLMKELKNNKIKHEININACYMIISYGYMLQENTLLNDIKRILPGEYIEIDSENNCTVKEYFKFKNKINPSKDRKELIDKVDHYFKKAINRQFEKDIEYGFKHFVGLSGGLDSRMTSIVAHQMGYTNQLNYTFSQSNYLDQTIPQKISSDLATNWIFKSLDNGLFLKDVDDVVQLTGGNSCYYGQAHSLSMYKFLNFSSLGVCHTGQLGDVILGTYSSEKYHKKEFNLSSGANIKQLVAKVDFSSINIDFENEEMFKFYQRGFSGINSGLIPIQNYTETHSPFYDIDFMSFALSLPLTERYKHKIYFDWIKNKYPKAQNYIWEKTKKKPKHKSLNLSYLKLFNRIIHISDIHKFILHKVGVKGFDIFQSRSMNPQNYWFKHNNSLNKFYDDYFNENLSNVDDLKELKFDIINLYKSNIPIKKIHVISLLSSIKLINTIFKE